MRMLGKTLVVLGGLLAIGSAFMHGFMARAAVVARLPTATPDDTVAAINAGWMLGTLSMATLGLLALMGVGSLGRGKGAERVCVLAGALFFGYGAWAFSYRGGHTHFIGFMVIGGLLLLGAILAQLGAGARR